MGHLEARKGIFPQATIIWCYLNLEFGEACLTTTQSIRRKSARELKRLTGSVGSSRGNLQAKREAVERAQEPELEELVIHNTSRRGRAHFGWLFYNHTFTVMTIACMI